MKAESDDKHSEEFVATLQPEHNQKNVVNTVANKHENGDEFNEIYSRMEQNNEYLLRGELIEKIQSWIFQAEALFLSLGKLLLRLEKYRQKKSSVLWKEKKAAVSLKASTRRISKFWMDYVFFWICNFFNNLK